MYLKSLWTHLLLKGWEIHSKFICEMNTRVAKRSTQTQWCKRKTAFLGTSCMKADFTISSVLPLFLSHVNSTNRKTVMKSRELPGAERECSSVKRLGLLLWFAQFHTWFLHCPCTYSCLNRKTQYSMVFSSATHHSLPSSILDAKAAFQPVSQ